MQQTKYDYNALKLEYFKSDIDEIKGFWIEKGLKYNTRVATMTKGRGKEKQKRLKKAKKEELQELVGNQIEGNVCWKVGKDNGIEYMHPTQKPVEINERVLVNFTGKGEY